MSLVRFIEKKFPLLGLNASGFEIPDDWPNCYLAMLTVAGAGVDEYTAPETS